MPRPGLIADLSITYRKNRKLLFVWPEAVLIQRWCEPADSGERSLGRNKKHAFCAEETLRFRYTQIDFKCNKNNSPKKNNCTSPGARPMLVTAARGKVARFLANRQDCHPTTLLHEDERIISPGMDVALFDEGSKRPGAASPTAAGLAAGRKRQAKDRLTTVGFWETRCRNRYSGGTACQRSAPCAAGRFRVAALPDPTSHGLPPSKALRPPLPPVVFRPASPTARPAPCVPFLFFNRGALMSPARSYIR